MPTTALAIIRVRNITGYQAIMAAVSSTDEAPRCYSRSCGTLAELEKFVACIKAGIRAQCTGLRFIDIDLASMSKPAAMLEAISVALAQTANAANLLTVPSAN